MKKEALEIAYNKESMGFIEAANFCVIYREDQHKI